MSFKNADEVKLERIEAMGSDMGSIYHELANEFSWLEVKWSEYVQLFGTNPERIELLNKSAAQFFGVVEIVLMDDCLLHLAKLTDDPGKKEKRNLTIKCFIDFINESNKDLLKHLPKLIDVACVSTEFARGWRNWRIAHFDLRHSLDGEGKPLPFASREKVMQAIDSIRDVFNEIETHFLNSSRAPTMTAIDGDGYSLLKVLDHGVRAMRAKDERIVSGKYTVEDLIRRDL